MPRKFLPFLGVCWWCTSGCAALVVGAGAGTGAYTYVNGELVRTYSARYPATMAVCTQLLQDLGMPVKEQGSDGVQTTIVTERKDGTPMTIKVKNYRARRDGGFRADRCRRLLEQGSLSEFPGVHR